MEESKRPVGISILAVLHVAGGVLAGVVTPFLIVLLNKNPKAQEAISAMGLTPALLVGGIGIILVLAIASGIGMWKGRKWGWYLGSFLYMYSIVRNANALAAIPMLMNSIPPEEIANMSRGPSYYYIKYSARIIVHSLIYLYFFKGNVRGFFSLSEQKKWKPVLSQLGICIGFAVVISILARITN